MLESSTFILESNSSIPSIRTVMKRVACMIATSSTLEGKRPPRLWGWTHMDEATRRTALSYAHRCYEEELELLRTLARIPAPSRHEGRRGRFVRDWLRAAGAGDAHIDEVGNVICGIGTKDHDEVAVFCAHTDVVFPDTEELPLTEEDGVMCLYAHELYTQIGVDAIIRVGSTGGLAEGVHAKDIVIAMEKSMPPARATCSVRRLRPFFEPRALPTSAMRPSSAVTTGLMESIDPMPASAPDMRPPRRRNSSVSRSAITCASFLRRSSSAAIAAASMDDVNNVLYESKLIGYPGPYKDKVRTFCQNPGGFVSQENYDNGLAVVNGYSYKDRKSPNTNLAVLCSLNFREPFDKPIAYAKKVGEMTNMDGGTCGRGALLV